jgi:hypothetical protein
MSTEAAQQSARRRAIRIIRVSQVNGRDRDSFASPGEQRDRIRASCERENLELVDIIEQLDVFGGKPLENLRPVVEEIERGRVDVLVGAYFDRLFRNLREQKRSSTESSAPADRSSRSTSAVSRTGPPASGCLAPCSGQ